MLHGYLVFPFELSIIKVEATSEEAIEKGHIGLYGTDSGLYKDPSIALKHLLANIPDNHKKYAMKRYKQYR